MIDYTAPSSYGSCYRHRRNSDAFLEKRTSRHICLSDADSSSSEDDDGDEASSIISALSCNDDSSSGYRDALATVTTLNGESQMLERHINGRGYSCSSSSDIPTRNDMQPSQRISKHHHNHLLSRNHTTSAHVHYHRAKSESFHSLENAVSQDQQKATDAQQPSCPSVEKHGTDNIHESIKDNTQDEPMSSTRALHILNTMFSTASSPLSHQTLAESRMALESGQDDASSCKHCISEAMVSTHKAAAKGVVVQHGGQSELRMNLGNGRNAIYVAPCERHLECPLDRKGKYLIHTNKSKIM
ncbi:hypothetical protein H4217_004915, partial [Coemansia sp. RSA 1939]